MCLQCYSPALVFRSESAESALILPSCIIYHVVSPSEATVLALIPKKTRLWLKSWRNVRVNVKTEKCFSPKPARLQSKPPVPEKAARKLEMSLVSCDEAETEAPAATRLRPTVIGTF